MQPTSTITTESLLGVKLPGERLQYPLLQPAGSFVRPETRDTTKRLAADTMYVTVDAAQSADDDIAKLEQRQPAWSWQNERFRQEGPAGGAEENVLHLLEINGTTT